jgi:protein phosphatase
LSEEKWAVEASQVSCAGQQEQKDYVGSYTPPDPAELAAHGRLYVIADALGGTTTSDIAARYAVQKVLYDFYHAEEPDLELRLRAVIEQLNQALLERNNLYPERRPAAITLLAALLHQDKLWIANVGDSRAYLVWDGGLEHINRDHTFFERLAREPQPPAGAGEEGAEPKPALHPVNLPLCLGLAAELKIDIFARRLSAGDNVMLCSGALAGYLKDNEIMQAVTKNLPDKAIERLVKGVIEQGSQEKVSLTVARVLSKPLVGVVPVPPPPPTRPDWEALAKKPPLPKPQPSLPKPPVPTPGLPKREWEEEPRRQWWILYAAVILILVSMNVAGVLAWWYGASPTETPAALVPSSSPTSSSPTTEATLMQSPLLTTTSPITPEIITATTTGDAPAGSPGNPTVINVVPAAGIHATPTPPPLPANYPSDCTNRGRFSGDLGATDGDVFAPGETFKKGWRIRNAGACPWVAGYTLRFVGGTQMSLNDFVPLPTEVKPGETAEILVPMTAPRQNGEYRTEWQLYSIAGEPFGPKLYLDIAVEGDETTLPAAVTEAAGGQMLYDFVGNTTRATWFSGEVTYTPLETAIKRDLTITFPRGIVALGEAELKPGFDNPGPVLLTHPHQELGLIEGVYDLSEIPLLPTDQLVATLGFPRVAILNDDGVTFELLFRPVGGEEQVIFSRLVTYPESPVTVTGYLEKVRPGQTGSFVVRALSGESRSYDWALWIQLQLVRP